MNTAAINRLNHSSLPYTLVDGTVIASDWNDLVDGDVNGPVNKSATGASVSGLVWTGSDNYGRKASYNPSDYPSGYDLDLTCSNWTFSNHSTRIQGARGDSYDTNAWLDYWQNDGTACAAALRLYCVQQ